MYKSTKIFLAASLIAASTGVMAASNLCAFPESLANSLLRSPSQVAFQSNLAVMLKSATFDDANAPTSTPDGYYKNKYDCAYSMNLTFSNVVNADLVARTLIKNVKYDLSLFGQVWSTGCRNIGSGSDSVKCGISFRQSKY